MRALIGILAVLSGLFVYLVYSSILPLEPHGFRYAILGLFILFWLAILWMPLSYWRTEKRRHPVLEKTFLYTAYVGMGFVSFSLVLSVIKDVSLLLANHHPWTDSNAAVVVLIWSAIFCVIGYWNATQGVSLKEVEVPIENLHDSLAGFKILQISDLHVGPTIRRKFVEHVVKIANGTSPDVVAITGDLVDGEVIELGPEVEPLRGLQAKLGKVYVLGNHEYYWDANGWKAKMETFGFKALMNESTTFQTSGAIVRFAGLTDPAAGQFKMEKPDFEKAESPAPRDANILLVHQPQYAEAAAEKGYQLQLSGHTHGGQFFPWTMVAARVHRHLAGLDRVGSMWVYVSRGTGYWGPPIRLGAPSEVTLLTLVKA